jgi:hypothetical protein
VPRQPDRRFHAEPYRTSPAEFSAESAAHSQSGELALDGCRTVFNFAAAEPAAANGDRRTARQSAATDDRRTAREPAAADGGSRTAREPAATDGDRRTARQPAATETTFEGVS